MSVELMCKCIADNGLTSFKMYWIVRAIWANEIYCSQ